jgi:hypothetical protein
VIHSARIRETNVARPNAVDGRVRVGDSKHQAEV